MEDKIGLVPRYF